MPTFAAGPGSPRSTASTESMPWNAATTRSPAPPVGGSAAIRSTTRPTRAASGIGCRFGSPWRGDPLQNDLVGGPSVINKVRGSGAVLLEVHERSDLARVSGDG